MKLLIVLACALSAGAAPILTTFESWTQGVLPSGHTQDGFTITSTPGALISVLPYIWTPVDPNEQPPPGTLGAPETWGNILAFNSVSGADSVFVIQFGGLVDFVGLRFADTNNFPSPRVRVQAFLGNTLLDTRDLLTLYATLDFGTLEMDRLAFYDLGGDGHVIDNLTYELVEVPEPSTGVLIALGVGLVLVRAARRRRVAA